MSQQFSLEKDKIRFLLLEGVHQTALDELHANGYTNIDYRKTALDEDALIEAIKDVHFVGIRSRTHISAKVLDAANKLSAIGCFCIGTNQVDLHAALERGIPVFNAPYSNTRSVAELVLGQLILLLRGIPEKNALVHRGGWSKSAEGSFEARGKTLGLVGYGSIGSQLSVLAESLGMKVIYFDVVTKLPLGPDCKPVFPHQFVRVNTIFEVIRNHGGRTAWADKHPAYDLVNGPSGKGVDDLYTPEITIVNGFDATTSVVTAVANDTLKVNAVVNEIRVSTTAEKNKLAGRQSWE